MRIILGSLIVYLLVKKRFPVYWGFAASNATSAPSETKTPEASPDLRDHQNWRERFLDQ